MADASRIRLALLTGMAATGALWIASAFGAAIGSFFHAIARAIQ